MTYSIINKIIKFRIILGFIINFIFFFKIFLKDNQTIIIIDRNIIFQKIK
jgi:hypothetical protein